MFLIFFNQSSVSVCHISEQDPEKGRTGRLGSYRGCPAVIWLSYECAKRPRRRSLGEALIAQLLPDKVLNFSGQTVE